jgi:hypothetical protein
VNVTSTTEHADVLLALEVLTAFLHYAVLWLMVSIDAHDLTDNNANVKRVGEVSIAMSVRRIMHAPTSLLLGWILVMKWLI